MSGFISRSRKEDPVGERQSEYGAEFRRTYSTDIGGSAGQRRSILDPHDSVMDLLSKQANNSGLLASDFGQLGRGGAGATAGAAAGGPGGSGTGASGAGLGDSWQAINKEEYSFLNTLGELNQQFGGVLSSDTSEEEPEVNPAPSPNMAGSQHSQFVSYPAAGYLEINGKIYHDDHYGQNTVQTDGIGNNVYNGGAGSNRYRLGKNGRLNYDDEDDDKTIMVNLGQSWAGSFFVMPKLSLSESMKRFKILIVGGDSAKSFYNRLSRYHQSMFEVGKFNDVSLEDAQKYTAFMVIFTDSKKVRATLDMIWKKYGKFTLIPICQKGQKQSVTEYVKRFASSNKIKLMSYPVVMSDHYEVHGLLRHLHALYLEVDSDYDADVPKRRKPKKGKKRATSYINRKWWFWTVSIALGVGIGCCVTLLFGSCEINPYNMSLDIARTEHDSLGLIDVVESATPSVIDEKPPHSIPEFFGQVFKLLKDTAVQFNDLVKQFLSAHVMSTTWVQSIGKELLNPDPQSTVTKVTALDLVML